MPGTWLTIKRCYWVNQRLGTCLAFDGRELVVGAEVTWVAEETDHCLLPRVCGRNQKSKVGALPFGAEITRWWAPCYGKRSLSTWGFLFLFLCFRHLDAFSAVCISVTPLLFVHRLSHSFLQRIAWCLGSEGHKEEDAPCLCSCQAHTLIPLPTLPLLDCLLLIVQAVA